MGNSPLNVNMFDGHQANFVGGGEKFSRGQEEEEEGIFLIRLLHLFRQVHQKQKEKLNGTSLAIN